MKRFSILCCLVLLLNVLCPVGHVHAEDITTPTDLCDHQYGWWADGDDCVGGCLVCKEENVRQEHTDRCTKKNICTNCGCEGDFYYYTDHNFGSYIIDGMSGHSRICADCGYVDTDVHTATYENSGVCRVCGYENEDIIHDLNRYGSADGHGYYCFNCDYKTEPEEHTYVTKSDKNYHWEECSVCEYTKGGNEYYCHVASCTNPGVCEVCGYENESLTGTHSWNENGVCSDCNTTCTHTAGRWNWQNDQHSKTCSVCGASFDVGEHTLELALDQTDEEYHWYACSVCTFIPYGEEHVASCTNPGVCKVCGYEGTIEQISHDFDSDGICVNCGEEECSHDWGELEFDVTGHWQVCSKCKAVFAAVHYFNCSGVCVECGYEDAAGDYESEYDHVYDGVAVDADWHKYVCSGCGQEQIINGTAYMTKHWADCKEPDVCWLCGYEGENMPLSHVSAGSWEDRFEGHDDDYHWYTCVNCGNLYKEEHYAFGVTCGEAYTCSGCHGELIKGHTWGDPVVVEATATTDGSKTYTCTECGETKVEVIPATGAAATATPTAEPTPEPTAEPTVEPTAEPTVEPTVEPVVTATPTPELNYEPDETATPAPTTEPEATEVPAVTDEPKATDAPAVTDEPEATNAPAVTDEPEVTDAPVATDEPEATATPAADNAAEDVHAHAYGVCTPNANGTHSQACACGDVVTSACTMVDTKIGTMDASACIYCGYITWKLSTIVADDSTQEEAQQQGTQEAKVIENAVFELVDKAGESIVTESLSLTVYESAPEVTIQLDTGANVLVKKALTITVLEDSTPVKLANTVKLSIPMEDDLTGLKLLVVDENGELVEIAYEVVDGVMVFETDILGIFMLVEEI